MDTEGMDTENDVTTEDDGVWRCVKGFPIPAPEQRPGALDRTNFKCGPGTDFWASYVAADQTTFAPRLQEELASITAEFNRPADLPYWSYHVFRTGFFSVQGFAGVLAAQLTNGSSLFEQTPAVNGNNGQLLGTAGRLVLEAVASYQQDYRNIQNGSYKEPWDMQPGHRQFNPLFVLNKAQRFISESVHVLDAKDTNASTDVWNQDSKLYPKYFRHTFHYQKDGWFSQDSAKVYESSTETLFVGRQDAMQRGTLVPFAEFMKGRDEAQTTVLEVAAGTGRFHTFLRDNYPALSTVCSDLSPFYLSEARDNMAYWQRFKGDAIAGTGETSFVQANGEDMPFADESFDAVLNVYLFHELPLPARKNVFAEVARVLKPGGMFVLTDSLQLGDRPSQDAVLGNFGDFAEPHYRDYVRTDFAELARECGFACDAKELMSSTKTLSFIKK